MTDWLAWVGGVGGTIGAVGGLTAAAVAIPAWRAGKVSAAASIRAAKAAEENTQAAERAATAAEDATAEARRLSSLELDRRHEELSPARSLRVEFLSESNERLRGGHRSLMAIIESSRTCRVRAVARMGNASWDLGLPLVLQAGHPTRVEVEKWPPDRTEPQAKELVLRFWPPADIDQVEQWTCRCGRPLVEEAGSEPIGHWETVIPVDYYDAAKSVW
jgi:hypothetical protein